MEIISHSFAWHLEKIKKIFFFTTRWTFFKKQIFGDHDVFVYEKKIFLKPPALF